MAKRSREVRSIAELLRPWAPLVGGALHLVAVIVAAVIKLVTF